jgi:hypothetical protein
MSVCAVCGEASSNRESDPHGQFGYHDFVPKKEDPPPPPKPDPLRDAAFRAGVWQVIEQRAKELKDEAKAELVGLEVGDTVAGRWDGKVIAKATKSKGRTKLAIHDEAAFLEWVKATHPTEVVESVNPAYVKSLEARAKDLGLGAVIDSDGEVVPGVSIIEGEPFVSVRRDKDAPFVVAQLLSSGRLSLEGVSRWQQDTEAGAIGCN